MSCNMEHLHILLYGDEDSALFRAARTHVDQCPHCQSQLLELSSECPLVHEACEVLRDEGEIKTDSEFVGSSVTIQLETLLGADNSIDSEVVSLDFLAPSSQPDLLGRLGRYEVEKLVGTGGMGVVLKGFDTELHRVVAIKVLLPHLANSGAARRRFAREAQAAAAVVNEHVVPIHNVEIEGELPYLVMKFVPGQSLQCRVDEQGPLPVREVLRLARQAALGLAAAHAQGVVHRDVKPANMLLEEKVDRLLISDFGLARTVDDATLTRTGIVAGTPHYMSPEQAQGDGIDHRSDLFSLGSVMYFMCAGRPPFRAASPMAVLQRICHEPHRPVDEVNAEIPLELTELIERLLSKRPELRPLDAHEVAASLDEMLQELQRGGHLRRRSWSRRWIRAVQPWRGRLVLSAAWCLCLVLGVWGTRWYTNDAATETGRSSVATQTSQQPTNTMKHSSTGPSPRAPLVSNPLEPDTFAVDLQAARELLGRIESRDTDSPTAFPDRSWEQNASQLRSLLEAQ